MAAERRLTPRPAAEVSDRGPWAGFLAAPTTVATLLILALAARTFGAGRVVSPWIMIDELTYADLARSFAGSGSFALRGEHAAVYSVLYPILIAPAWLAHSMEATYAIAKGINTLLVTVAGIPFYVWARRLVTPGYALLALVLFLLLPSLLYAGTLMTENAALPAFLLAAFLLGLALEWPTLTRQMLVLGSVGLAALVRVQGLVLIAVVVTAIVATGLLEWRAEGRAAAREKLVRFWPTLAALAVAAAVYAGVTAARGTPLHGLFGAYGVVATTHYSVAAASLWVVRHFAELGLAVALLPAAALVVLLSRAIREPRSTTPEERAFLAVAAASVVWYPIQSGVFASHFAHRVEERTMMYAEPLLLLALVIWLARGMPRPRVSTALAVIGSVVILLALPLGSLLVQSAVSDTFGLVPLLALRQHEGMGAVLALVSVGAAALAVIFVGAPRRLARVLVPLAVAAYLAASTLVVGDRIGDESHALRAAPQVGDEVEWVDRRIGRGGDAGFLYTSAIDPQAVWQTEFWNRSLGRVLRLGAIEPGGLPGTTVSLNARTGRIRSGGTVPEFVVAPRDLTVVGVNLAEKGPWRLYRASRPLRLESSLQGTASDGWMGNVAVYTAYRVGRRVPRALEIVLSRHNWGGPDVPGRVHVDVRSVGAARPAAVRAGVLHSSQELEYVVPAPPAPFRVRISIEPTFSPSDFGLPDERQLGAIPSFKLLSG